MPWAAGAMAARRQVRGHAADGGRLDVGQDTLLHIIIAFAQRVRWRLRVCRPGRGRWRPSWQRPLLLPTGSMRGGAPSGGGGGGRGGGQRRRRLRLGLGDALLAVVRVRSEVERSARTSRQAAGPTLTTLDAPDLSPAPNPNPNPNPHPDLRPNSNPSPDTHPSRYPSPRSISIPNLDRVQ